MKIRFRKIDWALIAILFLLLISGVVAIYSASTTRIGQELVTENYYLKQFIWIIISLVLLVFLFQIPSAIIDFLIVPVYLFSLLLLLAVLFLPEVKGAHRWIQLGFLNIQPSEIAKIATILLLAKLLAKPHLTEKQILFRSFPVTLIPVILILMEPDLSTSLVFFVIMFAILAASDLPNFYLLLMFSPLISMITSFNLVLFLICLLLIIILLYKSRLSTITISFVAVINVFIFIITPVLWGQLRPYQQNRILTFIDPLRDPFGAGYQIIQSKIAIGSGRVLGKGFLAGTQKNLKFLPEHHTDFIFSVLGEEFGFLGCLIILILFFLLLYRLSRCVNKLKVSENRFAAVGILSYLSFQIFVNIGMNAGIVPATGIPLPFISYGGSNLIINVLAIGLILKALHERSIFE
ncbi:MAG: rod shape-determining protein RodA [Candidatus Cloacimonetes bacterium]|nr:rod shape-determining protein RodA [Candidatus Cloacimonadota bacterium]